MKTPTLLAVFALIAACVTPTIKSSGSAVEGESQRFPHDPQVAAKRVVAHAAGRGYPYINFEDGVELTAIYQGMAEVQNVLEQNAKPRALASADFDEDGVPDLICGYACADGGTITLHRGNIDSLYQNSPEAQQRKREGTFTDSAFLAPARAFDIPMAADFVETGDFDADGHWDVIVAALRGKILCYLPGDGKGSFLGARTILLPGAVTSLLAGEVNRADGLTDLVVGVAGDDGPKVLVLEGPEGAVNAVPEGFSLQGQPSALVLGQLDDDYTMDLAVGAGSELIIIHGRDRKLSFDDLRRSEVLPARIERLAVNFEIQSIGAGDFKGTTENTLALLSYDGTVYLFSPRARGTTKAAKKKDRYIITEVLGQWPGTTRLFSARISTGPADDLVLQNRDRHSLQILNNGRSSLESSRPSSAVLYSASIDVEAEPVAVLSARLNGDAMSDLVLLRAGYTNPVILKTTAAQTFTVNNSDDHDDGVCDGKDCTLREAINAANDNPGADAIVFNIPGAGVRTIVPVTTLPALTEPATVDGSTQPGFAGSPLIQLSGNGNVFAGLSFEAGNSRLQGFVINGSSIGISISGPGNNIIVGNYIGTNETGSSGVPNQHAGLELFNSPSNVIGGTVSASRNVISGQQGTGIEIRGSGSSGTVVQGNYIGPDATGTAPIGNIGLDGISVGSASNTIGGTTAGARNVISANRPFGIRITTSELSGNLIQGNYIGINATGSGVLPNFLSGIFLGAEPNTTIGGTTPAARNVISGHSQDGIVISASGRTGIQVQGNFIGTDASGTVALGNQESGISIGSAAGGLIGGALIGARNVISGTTFGPGIEMFGQGLGIQVQGNYIGTDAAGVSSLGNNGPGIKVDVNNSVSIGGQQAGEANLIAFNSRSGVYVESGSGVDIRRNSIFSNTDIAIDLAPPGCFFQLGCDGVTLNDSCDSDVGANGLQNFPVLSQALANGNQIRLKGSLNSTANTTFTLEFFTNAACDPSGFGEAQTFVGSALVSTNMNCDAIFDVTLPVGVPVGQFVTATATDPAGNTSELSRCILVEQDTVFDLCLQDESNGNILRLNSTTGQYQFTNCRGIVLSGVGDRTVRGCLLTFQVNGPDRRILARIDSCSKTATASIQLLSQGTTFSIFDRNTTNNTCACEVAQSKTTAFRGFRRVHRTDPTAIQMPRARYS